MRNICNNPSKPEWEPWFAWHSVSVGKDGTYGTSIPQDGEIVVWWEWVERKYLEYRESVAYAYRLPQGK
jgi:predicted amidohydrolase